MRLRVSLDGFLKKKARSTRSRVNQRSSVASDGSSIVSPVKELASVASVDEDDMSSGFFPPNSELLRSSNTFTGSMFEEVARDLLLVACCDCGGATANDALRVEDNNTYVSSGNGVKSGNMSRGSNQRTSNGTSSADTRTPLVVVEKYYKVRDDEEKSSSSTIEGETSESSSESEMSSSPSSKGLELDSKKRKKVRFSRFKHVRCILPTTSVRMPPNFPQQKQMQEQMWHYERLGKPPDPIFDEEDLIIERILPGDYNFEEDDEQSHRSGSVATFTPYVETKEANASFDMNEYQPPENARRWPDESSQSLFRQENNDEDERPSKLSRHNDSLRVIAERKNRLEGVEPPPRRILGKFTKIRKNITKGRPKRSVLI